MPSQTASILIIDDKVSPIHHLRAALKRTDLSIAEANDARKAIEQVMSLDPDIILLGIDDNTGSWPQIISQISAKSPDRLVITFCNGNTSVDDVNLSFRLGAFDCLSFPLTGEDEMYRTIDRALIEAERRRQDRISRDGLEKALRVAEKTIARLKTELKVANQALAEEQDKRLYAENTARQTQQTYHIMFENTHDAIIHFDRDGFVLNTNETITDIFGLTPEEVRGRDLGDYDFLGYDYRQALELYKNAASDIPFPPFEMEAFSKNGARIYIETRAKPILSDDNIEGIINIVRNITPQKKLENSKNATILGLAKLAESRDDCTGGHLERVREYARMITEAIAGLPKYANYITPAYIKDIYLSSILHDIGKVSVPDAILLKPGRLTPEEFDIIKQHTLVGGNALAAVDAELKEQSFLTLGKEIAYYHHESWDGNGYPEGLKGEGIPLSARIVALADVYDALTTKRVYKEAYSHEKAAAIIMEERGKKFDPEIVDAFAANLEAFDSIRLKINDDIPALYHLPRRSTPEPA